MSKMGRPKIEIDFEQINKLCGIWCTLTEIASFFDCSEDTIERRIKEEFDMTFAEYYKIKSGSGRISLRRAQYKKGVVDGNTTMLIWLGKQHLDQSDKVESDHHVSLFDAIKKANQKGQAQDD